MLHKLWISNFSHNNMKYILFSLSICLLLSCSEKKPTALKKITSLTFSLPEVPTELFAQEERNQFLSENYWSNFNFQDTLQLHNNEQQIDQIFNDYIGLLSRVPFTSAEKGLKIMMQKAETNSLMFGFFIDLCTKHLYDPNSSIRNERMYIVVLGFILESNKVGDEYKIRYRHRLELAMKNRPGEKATDFRYTLITGIQGRLYNIKSSYVLIFFNNPDCEDCKNVKLQIASSNVILKLQKKGALKILSIFPDKDLKVWYDNQTYVPDGWISAYDKGVVIETKELYDLKAIPTLYLLNKDKQILIKDARFEEIENYLHSN
jgi:hypothetical protein